jgi:homoserine O-acetyltransferase
MSELKHITIFDFISENHRSYETISLSYQSFGRDLHTAPVVLVNHALTGNSEVAGENGWWQAIIGDDKLIDTLRYSVLSFDIPNNGYNSKERKYAFDEFSAQDIANMFGKALEQMNISTLHAAIGSSLGGGIAWEMAVLFPDLIKNLIPIASDWWASDWILGHNRVQMQILENSKKPLHDARMMAMLFYRSPASLKQKFNRTENTELGIYNIESWLLHHGEKLEDRFTLLAYKTMTHLLSSVDISKQYENLDEAVERIEANVIQIGVNSDLFFIPDDIRRAHEKLVKHNKKSVYREITSIHGHDAFLIEFEQLVKLLEDVF